MQRLDCLGDICPLPLIKLMQYKQQLSSGEHVMLVTDHSCTCASILSYSEINHIHTSVHEPVPGIWEITLWQDAVPSAGTTP